MYRLSEVVPPVHGGALWTHESCLCLSLLRLTQFCAGGKLPQCLPRAPPGGHGGLHQLGPTHR